MSHVLGVDLHDAGPIVIMADRDGTITSRELRQPGASRLGIAVRNPAEAGVNAALGQLITDLGMQAAHRIVSRGTAIALGEQWRGAAVGAAHVVALAIDDSVYAGIAIDGRPFEGAHGLAGAAGWLALNPVEREDYRKFGCLEAEIGLAGIVRRIVWRIKAGDRSGVLDAAGGDFAAITARHVFEGARAGDGVAVSVVRDTARYVGMAVANLAAVLDPDMIVLGGAIAAASDLFLEPSRAEMTRRLPASMAPALVAATLGTDAAALGAARAAILDA